MAELFGILFLAVVAPIWLIAHYVTKWKTTKGLSGYEEKLLEDLWQESQRMETRINTLETILDDREEGWRKKT